MKKTTRRFLALLLSFLMLGAYAPSSIANGEPVEEGIVFYDYEINVFINPEAGGTVTGDGPYNENDSVTLTATANEGFAFAGWLEDGELVSDETTLSFAATSNRVLNADFEALCTVIWLDGDGSTLDNGVFRVSEINSDFASSTDKTPIKASDGVNTFSFAYWSEADWSEDGKTVTFTPIFDEIPIPTHTLTIDYVYADQTQASPSYTATLAEGAEYSVDSPAVEGFIPSLEAVSGTMGKTNVAVTVTYTATTSGDEPSNEPNVEPGYDPTSENEQSKPETPGTYIPDYAYADVQPTTSQNDSVNSGNTVPLGSVETSTNADGSQVKTERETGIETVANPDGSFTVTDTMKETVTTDNKDGSTVEVKTENTKEETTGSRTNADGSVTDTTETKQMVIVTETVTDADGNKSIAETKTEQEIDTGVTITENDDGSVTETTETTETEKVTEKVTDADGNVSETVTETVKEIKIEMTIKEDGTEEGTSTTTATVKDENGNVLSESVTEAEITARTDENGTKTTETKATTTTKDADGNETVLKTDTTENKTADGSTGTVVKDDSGNVLFQETAISQEEFDKAMAENRPIQAPLTVDPNSLGLGGELSPIKISLPPSAYDKDGDGKVSPAERPKIEIQVTVGKSSVIAAEVSPDGTLSIKKDCYEGSVIVPLTGSGELVVIDNAKTFADVAESDWYYEFVTFVTAREIMGGAEEGVFAPDETMSRALLAQVLYGFDPSAKAGNGAVFNDVSEDDAFCEAIGWAYENGFAEGIEGSFKPLEDITCQDMITFLYRWAKSNGYNVSASASFDSFSGADSVADDAVDALRWAAAMGLFSGIDEGTLNLTGSVTRAQAAAIMTMFVRNAL